jgi:hypothetical protein
LTRNPGGLTLLESSGNFQAGVELALPLKMYRQNLEIQYDPLVRNKKSKTDFSGTTYWNLSN